jgi:hypothetical protein
LKRGRRKERKEATVVYIVNGGVTTGRAVVAEAMLTAGTEVSSASKSTPMEWEVDARDLKCENVRRKRSIPMWILTTRNAEGIYLERVSGVRNKASSL